jgi:hypothetical protein
MEEIWEADFCKVRHPVPHHCRGLYPEGSCGCLFRRIWLEQQLERETKSALRELREKRRLLELEEKERKLQNIPQEIVERYNSADTKIKKMEGIAYE